MRHVTTVKREAGVSVGCPQNHVFADRGFGESSTPLPRCLASSGSIPLRNVIGNDSETLTY